MRVLISTPAGVLHARLNDTQCARDFWDLLPLDLSVSDFMSSEKLAVLPHKLCVEGAPPGSTPSAGDLSYYGPWGTIAFFYRDSFFAKSLVNIGALEGSAILLTQGHAYRVHVERDSFGLTFAARGGESFS